MIKTSIHIKTLGKRHIMTHKRQTKITICSANTSFLFLCTFCNINYMGSDSMKRSKYECILNLECSEINQNCWLPPLPNTFHTPPTSIACPCQLHHHILRNVIKNLGLASTEFQISACLFKINLPSTKILPSFCFPVASTQPHNHACILSHTK